MKRFFRITTVAIVVIISGMLLVGCNNDPLVTSDNPFGLYELGDTRPEGEKIELSDLDVDTNDENALAIALYELANLNDKTTAHRAMYSFCPTSNVAMGMDNRILVNILEIKNGDEFFRVDYRLEDDVPIFSALPKKAINNALELVVTERRYANTDMDYTRYQKIKNAQTTVKANEDDPIEEGIPYAIWEEKDITEITDPEQQPSKPQIFSASQEGTYYKSAHNVSIDTISEASVEYREDEGVYFVSMTLDVSNPVTTENTRPLIQEGSGADNADYNEIVIEFEMWDNGYYKEFWSNEYWSATLNIFSLEISSTFEYHDVYSYDVRDCDISKYYADGEFVDYTSYLFEE